MHPWGDVIREANVPWGIDARPNRKDYGCHFSAIQRRWVVTRVLVVKLYENKSLSVYICFSCKELDYE